MDCFSITQMSEKWGISSRRIQILCSSGRINGAKKIGNYWVIPTNAEKPKDDRIKAENMSNGASSTICYYEVRDSEKGN